MFRRKKLRRPAAAIAAACGLSLAALAAGAAAETRRCA